MEGNKFTERKQHSEGNQVLFPDLWCLHRNHPISAPGATPSAPAPVPGLILAVGSGDQSAAVQGPPVPRGGSLYTSARSPRAQVTHGCCCSCCCQTDAALQKSLLHELPSCLDCSRDRFRLYPRNELPDILSSCLQWEIVCHFFPH